MLLNITDFDEFLLDQVQFRLRQGLHLMLQLEVKAEVYKKYKNLSNRCYKHHFYVQGGNSK